MHAQAKHPAAPASTTGLAPEALQAAWASLYKPTWPATYEAAMQDPVLSRMVTTAARHPAPAVPPVRQGRTTSAPSMPLPAMRSATKTPAAHRPAPQPRELPEGCIDRKRAASGERDDD